MMIAEFSPKLSLTCRRCYNLGSRYQPVITAIYGPNPPKLDKHNADKSHHMTLRRFNGYLNDLINDDEKAKLITQVMYKHNGSTYDIECDTLEKFSRLENLSSMAYQTDFIDCRSVAKFDNFIKLQQLKLKLNYIPRSLNHFITRLMQISTLQLLVIDIPCNNYSEGGVYEQLAELEDISTYIPVRDNFKLVIRFCHCITCKHLDDSYDMNSFTIVFAKCPLCRNHFIFASSRHTIYSTLSKAYGWLDNRYFIKRKLRETQRF